MKDNILLILRAWFLTFIMFVIPGCILSFGIIGQALLISSIFLVPLNVFILVFLRFGLKFKYIFQSLKQLVTECALSVLSWFIVMLCSYVITYDYSLLSYVACIDGVLLSVYVIIRIIAIYHPQIIEWGNTMTWHDEDLSTPNAASVFLGLSFISLQLFLIPLLSGNTWVWCYIIESALIILAIISSITRWKCAI